MARKSLLVIFALLSLTLPESAGATAMTVLGSSSGQNCFMSASLGTASAASLAECRKALRERGLGNRDRAATHVNMGILLNTLDRTDEALDSFDKALKISPKLPEAALSRGNSHFLRREYELARVEYEKSLAWGIRQKGSAHFNHGLVHRKTKNYEQAALSFRRAIAESPELGAARAHLEKLYTTGKAERPREESR